ncbi:MAG: Dam family site-specific DNA-(adenine-N6)-methyltransferase [Rickettsiales bacterium]|jgi:DNA adenine methylase|nr:Dam family site-specific DNA-(adenine-N6)-methyltransferase [Rickettsiales bacterium]
MGKGQLLPQINTFLPDQLKQNKISRYIEPFVGGGAVFFDLVGKYDFDEVFLFDINPELVILYNVIKNNVQSLISELSKIQSEYFGTPDQTAYYYARRDEFNNFPKQINANMFVSDFVRRAALTIFLNRTCFNGLFRVNSKNKFNVPMGKYANPRILDSENLLKVSEALQNAVIEQVDFAECLKFVNKDTFIYYDPPYRPIKDTSNFNSYAIGDFDDAAQRRLKDVFVVADKAGALQMLSNSDPTNYSDDRFFDDLYSDFNINRVMARRQINSKADGRNAIRELLITNY